MAFISGGRLGNATGGTISTISGYRVHTFDTVGLNTFTPTTNGLVEVLVVGGGAAGSAQTGGSGGGGGGSVLYTKVVRVSAGVAYTMNVGAGGINGNLGTDTVINLPTGTVTAFSGDVGIGSFGKILFSSVPSSINEGASGTFNVTTDKFPNGSTVFWTINNISTVDADFGAISGSFTINSNSGTFSVPIASDQLVDVSETFTVSLRSDSPSGNILVTSPAVTINNTTLVTTASTTAISEGQSVIFTTQAQGFSDGTTLHYDIVGGSGITAADFTSNSLSGTYTVSAGVASTTLTLFADGIIENDETFQLGVKTSVGGPILTLSPVITVLGPLFPFTSFTFTNATAEGTNGPTLANLQSAYSAQSWASNTAYLNLFSSKQGYQRWTVPDNATYRITASGAQGGAGSWTSLIGGFGAKMQATISLAKGDFLIFVVGQRGGYNDSSGNSSSGGGGGTFVFKNNLSTPILVAGGGGGGGRNNNGKSGETTNAGGSNTNGNIGGSLGAGGPSYAGGGGGAGITGSGGAGVNTAAGGLDITNLAGTGGRGGDCAASTNGSKNFNNLGQDQGGFGGAGGGEWCVAGSVGGGGGFSGGAGGRDSSGAAGGGGSFVNESLATLIGTSNGTYNGTGSFTNIAFNGSATLGVIFSNLMGSVLVEKL
jgi:hypothetical protein